MKLEFEEENIISEDADNASSVEVQENHKTEPTANDLLQSVLNTNEEERKRRNDDRLLTQKSENYYINITNEIVYSSINQLAEQNDSKNGLKKLFTWFFVIFIGVQYIAMLVMFGFKMFMPWIELSDTVIVAYISSVFVETLGAIVLMIKYAFDSSQETQVLAILNGVISNYQKFKITKDEYKN